MAHTQRIINAVARNILAAIETDYEGEYDFPAARRDNERGWTVELSAPLGNAVRHEGITLSEGELKTAYRRALAWQVAQ